MKSVLHHFGVKSQELPNAETCHDIILEFNNSSEIETEEEEDDPRSHTQEFVDKMRNLVAEGAQKTP